MLTKALSTKFCRYAPLAILVGIALAPHHRASGQEPEWPALLERLRSDDTPGNASRALRKLEHIVWTSRSTEMMDQLRVLSDDPDPQMSQYASYLLATAQPGLLLSETEMMARFVAALSDDALPFSASHSWIVIGRLIREENPAGLRDQLVEVLHDSDHQARQLAIILLILSYREAGVPESQWPEAVFESMMEGLRNDWVRAKNLFPNATAFFDFLFEIKEYQPVELLAQELAGEDPQSRFAAAILLAHYRHEPSQRQIVTLLVPYLVDDRAFPAIPAYQALVWTGPENTTPLLGDFQPVDWQQAALLVCAGAFHGLSPPYVTDAHRQEWLLRSETSSSRFAYMKIAKAALYLDAGVKPFLEGKELSASLSRMFAAGKGVHGLTDRAKWMASWLPILDPYVPDRNTDRAYRARSVIVWGSAEMNRL